MTLVKTDYGNWSTLTGTLAEVAGALNTNNVLKEKVVAFAVDAAGTAYYAVYARN